MNKLDMILFDWTHMTANYLSNTTRSIGKNYGDVNNLHWRIYSNVSEPDEE
jgi:hypothetical protein